MNRSSESKNHNLAVGNDITFWGSLTGLEPATSGSTNRCSSTFELYVFCFGFVSLPRTSRVLHLLISLKILNLFRAEFLLSYKLHIIVAPDGVEPSPTESKSVVLPITPKSHASVLFTDAKLGCRNAIFLRSRKKVCFYAQINN